MSDVASATQAEATPEGADRSGSYRFPILWTIGLAGIYLLVKQLDIDPGIKYSIAFLEITLGAIGISYWAFFRSGLPGGMRWLVTLVPLLFIYSFSPLGPVKLILNGDIGFVGWRWRWAAQPDEKLAVPVGSEVIDEWLPTASDYPRFLGNGYWAEVEGVELETDWVAHPPKKLWQKEIGAGWSAFAIVGSYAVTQEQRGEQEMVTCYEVQTGEIVWSHADPVRWDPGGTGALGYAGPRATPTIHEGKVFVQGATGILNCLDAKTGKLIWSHDTLEKHNATNVHWGKACSPLIVNDMVVVSVGGVDNQSVVAYDKATGEVIWASGTDRSSYASPVLAEFGGVKQIVTVDEGFANGRRADNGEPLWQHVWPSSSGTDAACSQPIPLPNDLLYLSKGYGLGSSLLKVGPGEGGEWELEPQWKRAVLPVMKTKMGNVVIRDGYVYGLDEVNLQCIELATGKKQWKKRRRPKFGHGQIMLIGDVILILSEGGEEMSEVVLVEASPKKYRELASLPVFEASQITWNNPAFSSPYLLIRNAEVAACYELPVKGTAEAELAQKN